MKIYRGRLVLKLVVRILVHARVLNCPFIRDIGASVLIEVKYMVMLALKCSLVFVVFIVHHYSLAQIVCEFQLEGFASAIIVLFLLLAFAKTLADELVGLQLFIIVTK